MTMTMMMYVIIYIVTNYTIPTDIKDKILISMFTDTVNFFLFCVTLLFIVLQYEEKPSAKAKPKLAFQDDDEEASQDDDDEDEVSQDESDDDEEADLVSNSNV